MRKRIFLWCLLIAISGQAKEKPPHFLEEISNVPSQSMGEREGHGTDLLFGPVSEKELLDMRILIEEIKPKLTEFIENYDHEMIENADVKMAYVYMKLRDLQMDITRSEYFLSEDCKDLHLIKRGISTKIFEWHEWNEVNEADRTLCFNPVLLSRFQVDEAELIGRILHEHAHHYGFRDTVISTPIDEFALRMAGEYRKYQNIKQEQQVEATETDQAILRRMRSRGELRERFLSRLLSVEQWFYKKVEKSMEIKATPGDRFVSTALGLKGDDAVVFSDAEFKYTNITSVKMELKQKRILVRFNTESASFGELFHCAGKIPIRDISLFDQDSAYEGLKIHLESWSENLECFSSETGRPAPFRDPVDQNLYFLKPVRGLDWEFQFASKNEQGGYEFWLN